MIVAQMRVALQNLTPGECWCAGDRQDVITIIQ
jgi:hypothetical protein